MESRARNTTVPHRNRLIRIDFAMSAVGPLNRPQSTVIFTLPSKVYNPATYLNGLRWGQAKMSTGKVKQTIRRECVSSAVLSLLITNLLPQIADSDDCGQSFRLIAGSVPNDRGQHSERRRAVCSRRRQSGLTPRVGCQARHAWRPSCACSRP
jgi:hypothetical protein